jgi:23S rRNA (cytosine1962-C5)-methyltransferase
MNNFPKIILKPGKEAALKRFHPWLFSGAIGRIEGNPEEGSIVEILSSEKEYLATGHYLTGSIAVKMFSFMRADITPEFWRSKLIQAYELRKQLGLVDNSFTNAYRLVFSEGDGLPGLFIDYYNGSVVIQTHTLGMHRIKPVLIDALKEIYGEKLVSVYDKSDETMGKSQSHKVNELSQGRTVLTDQSSDQKVSDYNQFLFGCSGKVEITETGNRFMVDLIHGQKTGFFLDQRSNRMFAQFYAKGKKVLNAFCYSGAFSVYALKGGATMVHSVDSSRQAMQWTDENIELNGIDKEKHRSFVAEVKRYLTETEEKYDMIVLDPPAFAKHLHVSHNALQAYIHINSQAMKRLMPGGLLFTFSCSQPISREMFQSAIVTAGLESGRSVKILHHLTQGPDHPVSLYHPEGAYLKGLILLVS